MRRVFVLLAAGLLASCAHPSGPGAAMIQGGHSIAQPMSTINGRPAWAIDCSLSGTMTACASRATALCPSGFDVVSADQRDQGATLSAIPDGYGGTYVFASQNVSMSMIVACR